MTHGALCFIPAPTCGRDSLKPKGRLGCHPTTTTAKVIQRHTPTDNGELPCHPCVTPTQPHSARRRPPDPAKSHVNATQTRHTRGANLHRVSYSDLAVKRFEGSSPFASTLRPGPRLVDRR